MPAIFAHKLIAKITLFDYPEKIKKIIHNYKEAYYSGTLGPDPLYFYGFMKKSPLTSKADEIHRTSGNILFAEKANNEEYTILVYGDVNKDGQVSNSDRIKVRNHILGTTPITQ